MMENTELIEAIRENEECNNCELWKHGECNERKMSLAAADALEALQDKPWVETVIEDKLRQKIDELEAQNELKDGTITAMSSDIGKLRAQLPKWISVDERLPEESGGYIAYIQEPHMIQKADWEEQYDFSFAMQLWFDKQKMLWSDNGEDSYNAYLPAVDTDNAFHVTHWMKLPEPPKGEQE